jgi:hypothetical protein
MNKALFTLLLFLLVHCYAQVTPGKLVDSWETFDVEVMYETWLAEQSVFANYSESNLAASLQTFDYCPGLYNTYQRLAINNPSLSARVFLDTVLNQSTADPTLKAQLGDGQSLLKEACTAFLGSYEQQVLLGLRLGFNDFVLDYFASFLRYSYTATGDTFAVPYQNNPEFSSHDYSDPSRSYSDDE